MASRQSLLVVTVVLAAVVGVVVPVVSAGADGDIDGVGARTTPTDDGVAATGTDGATGNASASATANDTAFGTQVAAFMQSNAAQTDDAVGNGMWQAAFQRANASVRDRMVRARAAKLNDTLATLAERNHTLAERYRNGSLSYEGYVAAASQLNGRVEALEDGVGGTSRAAQRAGLNLSALETLRHEASNVTGPEVAGVARSLVDGDRGPPPDVPGRGPPTADGTERLGRGPPGDATPTDPGNATGSDDPRNESRGANDTVGDDPPGAAGNGSSGSPGNGPPDNPGPPDDSGTGPPDDPGNGPPGDPGTAAPPSDDEEDGDGEGDEEVGDGDD